MQKRCRAIRVASVVTQGCRSESRTADCVLLPGIKHILWSRKMAPVLNCAASTFMKNRTFLPCYICVAPREGTSQSRVRKVCGLVFGGLVGWGGRVLLFCPFGRQQRLDVLLFCLFVKK